MSYPPATAPREDAGRPLDLVVVGHVTWDLAPDGQKIGGAAAYASAVATRLGLRTALVTCAGPEMDLAGALPGVVVTLAEHDQTTVMEHAYEGGRRIQYLRQGAGSIERHAIPRELSDTRMLLLCPVVAEVDPSIVRVFPEALILAGAQGWLRRIGSGGMVEDGHLEDLNLDELTPRVSILVLSQEDLAGRPLPAAWLKGFPILIISRGRDGLRLHHAGRWWSMPAFPAVETDSTGAGDALGAAFLVRYAECRDVGQSARFATAAASLVVEARGIEGAPGRAAVERRMGEHPEIGLIPEE